MEYKCTCGKEYKLERYYLKHIETCPDYVKETIDEETIQSDVVVSKEIVEPTQGFILTPDEKMWIDNFAIGFRFNGQVRSKDSPYLISVYRSNIKDEIKGCLTCPQTMIWLATCVIKKYEESKI